MKRNLILASVASSLLLLSACKEGSDSGISDAFLTEGTTVLATVNDQPITKQAVDTVKSEFAKRSRQPMNIPDERWTDELVNREVLYQEAKKKGLYNNPDIRTKLALSARSILSDAYVQDYMKDTQVSDAEIQTEYDTYAAKMKSPEFKARHILLKDEKAAKAVIAKLNKGADFSELAKKESTGPSGPKGGELGWFVPQQMVPAFSEAVAKLKDGEYTAEPVKTRFGYHVIIRDESREKQPPSLDKMRDSISTMIKQKKLQEHIKQLRDTSKVVINKPEVAPAPAQSPAAADQAAKAVKPATSQAEAVTKKAVEKATATQ
ncbi:MAG TPA: peptidylprolyl isomerase [Crenotrichaceae bacterium]|nr:peptidylprolyl isomerase [Crenotrichaceae bacterium]